MYCSQCGTQVPDDSVFCQECGAKIEVAETQDELAVTPSGPAPPPTVDQPARRPVDRPASKDFTAPRPAARQTFTGVAVIAGAVLAVIGSLLTWADLELVTFNGFDVGYLTDPEEGLGNDGLFVLVIGLIVGVLAAHYFYGRNALASLAVIGLGLAAAGIGAYNMGKLIQETQAFCDEIGASDCDALQVVGEGIYFTIAGGAVIAVAGLVGLIRAVAQPSGQRESHS